jgi:hypothetical protein
MSTKYNCTRRICEWSFVGQLALHDHRQLRTHSLGASEVKPDPIGFARPVHHMVLTYASPLLRTTADGTIGRPNHRSLAHSFR